jgi:nitrite reductase (NADH) small subunit/3-phenylpropionate/trans-cinnamate dioxygenase ferredoxin subunit
MSRAFENTRKPKREGKLLTIAKTDALPIGRGANVQLKDGAEIALFNANGKFFAIENFCPHRGSPLADSRLYGETVECDFHGWRFDLKTGECLTDPNCPIETYEVIIEDEMIKILV